MLLSPTRHQDAAPTKWTYKANCRIGDHPVGQWSADTGVIVGG